MLTFHLHQDDHPDPTKEEERKTRMKEEEEMSKEDLIKMKARRSCFPTNLESSEHRHPQFYPPNFVIGGAK